MWAKVTKYTDTLLDLDSSEGSFIIGFREIKQERDEYGEYYVWYWGGGVWGGSVTFVLDTEPVDDPDIPTVEITMDEHWTEGRQSVGPMDLVGISADEFLRLVKKAKGGQR